jgi:hypothetical protein
MWNEWAGLGVILLVGFVIFIFWACKADTSSFDKWLSAILDKEHLSSNKSKHSDHKQKRTSVSASNGLYQNHRRAKRARENLNRNRR